MKKSFLALLLCLSIVDDNLDANFLRESGNRIMIKRKLFEEYLDKASVI